MRRNINTQNYYRLLMTADAHRTEVAQEMFDNTAEYQADRLEFVKSPVIAEYLGFPSDTSVCESELEGAIIANLQQFLLEVAFVRMRGGRMRTVHEVSELAHVSVRTLHHYDQIGLLYPSARSEAGYRLGNDRGPVPDVWVLRRYGGHRLRHWSDILPCIRPLQSYRLS